MTEGFKLNIIGDVSKPTELNIPNQTSEEVNRNVQKAFEKRQRKLKRNKRLMLLDKA